MTTPRERARQRTLAEIRELAWRHLEENGAAALSLRAIARELGVVSSAIYRYVPSRDDLLTQLILEGYESLAEAAEGPRSVAARHGGSSLLSDTSPPDEKNVGRAAWVAAAARVRAWAKHRPAAWALLFGSPVPGYHAPGELTTPAWARTLMVFVRIVFAAREDGQELSPAIASQPLPAELAASLSQAAEEIELDDVDPMLVAATLLGWTNMIGAINSEIFEQLGPYPVDAAEAWAMLMFQSSADVIGFPTA